MNKENLNKKIEETKKKFEKMFSRPVSYHEENKWGRKNGIFTIKIEDPGSEKIGKFLEEGIEIFFSPEKQLLKEIGTTMDKHGLSECAVSVEINKGKKAEDKKNKDGWGGDIVNVNSENLEIKDQKNKLIERGNKSGESLNRHFIGDGKGLTYSIERNQKKREQELEEKQKEQMIEKATNQANQSPQLENKDSTNQNIYYGVGITTLVMVVVSLVVVGVKRSQKLK